MTIPYDLVPGRAGFREEVPTRPQIIEFRPDVFPPPNAVPFDVVSNDPVPPYGAVTIVVAEPTPAQAVIRWIGNETDSAPEYAYLSWTVLVGGVPQYPYVNMYYSRGTINNPDPVIIRIAPNRKIEVQIQNNDSAVHIARTRIKGWLY